MVIHVIPLLFPINNMWAKISTEYTACGTVHGFQNAVDGIRLQSIWRLYEYPLFITMLYLNKIYDND